MSPVKVTYPRVCVEEVLSGIRSMNGVSTSITIFIGLANNSKDQLKNTEITPEPVKIVSYPDYEQKFGPPHPRSDLATSVRLFFLNGGTECYVVNINDTTNATTIKVGRNETTLPSQNDVVSLYTEAIKSLDNIDIFNLLVITKLVSDTVNDRGNFFHVGMTDTEYVSILNKASRYCRERRSFLLIDPLDRWTTWQDPVRPVELTKLRNNVETENSAVYFPRLVVTNYDSKLKAELKKKIGPAAAVAGIINKIDSQNGVWKAPVGVNAVLKGIVGVDVLLNDQQNDVLNQQGINCVRSFSSGIVCWGARTVSGYMDGNWKYIPVRRLALFIEETLYRGTEWVLFEPNDESTWAIVRDSVGAFMMNLFKQGAFKGVSPKEAFFVKCDKDTTTESHRRLGIVNFIVGFAPLKPAEFVIIQIQQKSEL